MKFRALMQDPMYMREFQAIAATLAKLAKDCVMILGSRQMHFIVNEDQSSTASPLVWASIAADEYFPEYRMEAARPDQEYIVLGMSSANLGRALSVLRGGGVNSCKLKLQRIQFPCISVIASVLLSSSTEAREVVHDVPVTIIPASDWPAYVVPRVPSSQLALSLPSLRLLRSLIDKLKNVSPSLEFQANNDGELNVIATSEMSTVTSRFKKLLLRSGDVSQQGASCSVDSKKASAFFGALQLPNDELTIGIDREHTIHLQIDVRQDVVLHSILPAVCF
ncbi:checkpoint protein HUS1 [Drosophila ficusphila]|uniref:checkpoint protein HUS1 n=1 Tax=Drosophila ficusphila TaxID=30025 RepID=UPI0007E6E6D3|nr:checkpoint protein HUS1 [Drosophila ficusphila]XP_017046027.1 checkpoint protein HUS1 [Drosophila ficusphila]XP_017046028.1 checkpoint protein HUS1 [Drosophila ficusphila]